MSEQLCVSCNQKLRLQESKEDEEFLEFVRKMIGDASFQYLMDKEGSGDDEQGISTALLEMFVLLYTWNDLETDDRVIAWDAARAMTDLITFKGNPDNETIVKRQSDWRRDSL